MLSLCQHKNDTSIMMGNSVCHASLLPHKLTKWVFSSKLYSYSSSTVHKTHRLNCTVNIHNYNLL